MLIFVGDWLPKIKFGVEEIFGEEKKVVSNLECVLQSPLQKLVMKGDN